MFRMAQEAEFAEFVSARRLHMRRFAYLLCGDWHNAEDLVQTAFAKLYVAWPRIHNEGSEEAYVRRTIVRCHIDETRRPWRRETVVHDLPEPGPPPDHLSYEDLDQLRRAVRQLPDKQRVALVLRHWWGSSVEETARDMGCSPGTVKSHTSRATEAVRTALNELESQSLVRD